MPCSRRHSAIAGRAHAGGALRAATGWAAPRLTGLGSCLVEGRPIATGLIRVVCQALKQHPGAGTDWRLHMQRLHIAGWACSARMHSAQLAASGSRCVPASAHPCPDQLCHKVVEALLEGLPCLQTAAMSFWTRPTGTGYHVLTWQLPRPQGSSLSS